MSDFQVTFGVCPVCLGRNGIENVQENKGAGFNDVEHAFTKCCKKCEQMIDAGYVGLIEITGEPPANDRVSLYKCLDRRTGRVGWLNRDVFSKAFDQELSPMDDYVCVQSGILDFLTAAEASPRGG